MRKTVLELSSKEALKYFMEAENYCTLPLPSYFQFQKMLNYVKNAIQKRNFDDCLKDKKIMPSNMEGVNYKFLITKDGKYSFRPIQITNPYLYYLLVREITEENNWKKIQDVDFPWREIVNQEELDKLTPVISQEEVDYFYYDDFPGNK